MQDQELQGKLKILGGETQATLTNTFKHQGRAQNTSMTPRLVC